MLNDGIIYGEQKVITESNESTISQHSGAVQFKVYLLMFKMFYIVLLNTVIIQVELTYPLVLLLQVPWRHVQVHHSP